VHPLGEQEDVLVHEGEAQVGGRDGTHGCLHIGTRRWGGPERHGGGRACRRGALFLSTGAGRQGQARGPQPNGGAYPQEIASRQAVLRQALPVVLRRHDFLLLLPLTASGGTRKAGQPGPYLRGTRGFTPRLAT